MSPKQQQVIHGPSLLTDHDIYLFKAGEHYRLYEKLGSHEMTAEGQNGVLFAVWAPNASSVSVVGDFNDWDQSAHPLAVRYDGSGIWEGFIPGLSAGEIYKYFIDSSSGYQGAKGDPFAFRWQVPPDTASVVEGIDRKWKDGKWMKDRQQRNALHSPISIYEVHLGSWKRVPEDDNRPLTYSELADSLISYVKDLGYTHVEFLPVMEHPFYGSWGYQITGFFAPTSRYGGPTDFMALIDKLHQAGIGVILDWVPSHFPSDEHGLVYFDGTHLYEHADPRQGFHPDWKSYIFNYGRNEVRSFLLSNALFWLDRYHIDGLRVDAVASMLYLDYSRKDGEWIPNKYGGRENIEAIDFLKRFNEAVYAEYPDTFTVAEESTAWPMVSRPVYLGGLGFGMKWKMGWMHDTLEYFRKDPVYRKFHHDQLTFSIWYAFTENFVLPLSHDEVVYGKGSLIRKMPGDDWQKFANLRLLFGYMFTHPGKKLTFMGGEFGQWNEWNHESSLDWHLLEQPGHAGVLNIVRDLNRLIAEQPALHELDFVGDGFDWVDYKDYENSILSYIRRGLKPADDLLIICNFTPLTHRNYRAGVPTPGTWKELLNSDAQYYGGSGFGNWGSVKTTPVSYHGHYHSISLNLPPLGILVLKAEDPHDQAE